MDNLNIIEQAIKVTSFRKAVRDLCRKKGIDYPTDEKIAEYITYESSCDFDANKLVNDYINKVGIFKDPYVEFAAKIDTYAWGDNKPTEAEMREYIATKGTDVKAFLREHTINSYKPLERKVLLETLKLPIKALVSLWNTFIEESAIYGDDSCIYTLDDVKDVRYLEEHMTSKEFRRVQAIGNMGIPFLQWFTSTLNDGDIKNDDDIHGRSEDDIKSTIVAFWGEIFERIILFPNLYETIYDGKTPLCYFYEVVWEEFCKTLGYVVDKRNCKVTSRLS